MKKKHTYKLESIVDGEPVQMFEYRFKIDGRPFGGGIRGTKAEAEKAAEVWLQKQVSQLAKRIPLTELKIKRNYEVKS